MYHPKPRLKMLVLSVPLAGLLVWGCGPPEMVPVALPGSKHKVVIPEDQQAEALGEQEARGAVQPPVEGPNLSIPLAEATEPGKSTTTADNLKYETMRAGSGVQAKPGSLVQVHYTGTLTNGAQVDSSRGKQPLVFRIGADIPMPVIRGWHLGVAGMRVGEMRRLTLPPELAYGDEGSPPVIPPKSTLVFEIELLSVQ